MGIEITFDDQLDKEQAHLDKKILILHCCHTEIFLKEFSHDVGEKLEVSSLFFFFSNKISLEIKSHGHFSKGLTHGFGQKMKILSLFVFGQNGPGNNDLMIIEVENKPS